MLDLRPVFVKGPFLLELRIIVEIMTLSALVLGLVQRQPHRFPKRRKHFVRGVDVPQFRGDMSRTRSVTILATIANQGRGIFEA